MTPFEISILIAGGVAAGIVNTLAGGGSLLTVPLLILIGLPGTVANGTNRIGIGLQSLVGVWRFRAEGVSELRRALPVLVPIALGSWIGASFAARISDEAFEKLFGVVMLVLLIPVLRGSGGTRATPPQLWSPWVSAAVFFAIGLYGGAIQAGVGIVLLFALTHAGFDLVRANAFKLVVVSALALVSIPVFVLEDRIAWAPAWVLAIGFAFGAAAGARIAVRGGERVIRPVLALSVVAMAGRMLGLY